MIKAIIFDLSEVLLTGVKETGEALKEKHDLDTGDKKSPFFVSSMEEFFHGNVSEDEYLDEVLKEYPALESKEKLKNHIRENFREIDGTREVIARLKEKGYKLALLSIHGREWIEDCQQKFNHHDLFDVIAYSYEDKVSKPDKKSYELVIERLGVKADECIFIDDHLQNIKAAEELGVTGIQFFNAKQLESDLEKIVPNLK